MPLTGRRLQHSRARLWPDDHTNKVPGRGRPPDRAARASASCSADADDLELVGHVETGEEVVDAVERLRARGRDHGRAPAGHRRHLRGQAHRRGVPGRARRSMFSAYGDKRLLSDAIAAGARGYVMKGSPPEDLLRGDPHGRRPGKPFVDPSLSPALLMSQVGPDAPLSEREREILQLLAEGLHTEEVARRIGLIDRDRQVGHQARDPQARGRHARARRGDRAAPGDHRVERSGGAPPLLDRRPGPDRDLRR